MNQYKFRIRDLIAFPFMMVSIALVFWVLVIGSPWTAQEVLKLYGQDDEL